MLFIVIFLRPHNINQHNMWVQINFDITTCTSSFEFGNTADAHWKSKKLHKNGRMTGSCIFVLRHLVMNASG